MSEIEQVAEKPQKAETDFMTEVLNPESAEKPQTAETDFNTDGVNPESAPAEPSFEQLLEQFERENAPVAEPVAEPDTPPLLGQSAAPPEQVAEREQMPPDPVQRIFDDASASDDLRREASQLDAARQEFVRAAAERDFKQVYSDLTTSLAKDFPHIPPDLVGTIVAGRLFQLANSDKTVVAAFDNRHSNPRFYAGVIKHIGHELDKHLRHVADPDATADREAVRAYMMGVDVAQATRGASVSSAEMPEAPPPDFAQMTDAEMRRFTEVNYGFSAI